MPPSSHGSPEPPADLTPSPPRWRPALAWLATFLAFAFGYLVMLAGAMRTVPRFDLGESIMAGLGPVTGALVFGWASVRNLRAQRWARALVGYGIPAAVCLFWLLMIVGSALAMPSG